MTFTRNLTLALTLTLLLTLTLTRLVNGLAQSGALPAADGLASSPVLPNDILQQAARMATYA